MKKHAGIDVQAMYPAGSPPKADDWTLDTFLKAAEACFKGGNPFGMSRHHLRQRRYRRHDLSSFGAELVNAKGDLTVKTDSVRQALDYYKKLIAFLPPDAPSWDDASNNKFLVLGQASLIMNPPSAWSVAKRDAPHVAEQCWTHGFPKGPKGRFAPYLPYFLGHMEFLEKQGSLKSLIRHLSQPSSVEKLVAASNGYDLPAYEKLTTLKTWAEVEPPKGTLFHYPIPYHQTLSIAASPAPPKIAQQIYVQATLTNMCLRYSRARRWSRARLGRGRVRRLHAELGELTACGGLPSGPH